jgi:hypothetical protein
MEVQAMSQLPKISAILIGMFMLSGFMLGMSMVMGNLALEYGVDGGFDGPAFDQISEINEKTENFTTKLSGRSDFNPVEAFDILNFLFFELVPSFASTPNIVASAILEIGNSTGAGGIGVGQLMPPWLIPMAIGIVSLIVILGLISVIFRRDI